MCILIFNFLFHTTVYYSRLLIYTCSVVEFFINDRLVKERYDTCGFVIVYRYIIIYLQTKKTINITTIQIWLYFIVDTIFISLFETLLKNINTQQYNMFMIPIILINHGNPIILTNLPPIIGP